MLRLAKKMKKINSFSLLKGYFKQYSIYFLFGFLALLLVDGLQIAIPWQVRKAINILSSKNIELSLVLKSGVIIVALALGVGISRFIWRYYIIGISRRIEENLRNKFYSHLMTLPYEFFDNKSVGDLMAHATNDLEAVRMMCGMALVASTDAAVLMVASIVMMLTIDSTMTFYVLIPLPILTWTVLKLGPRLHSRFKKVQETFADITQKVQETFAGIKVVKSFVQESAEDENFQVLNRKYVNLNLRLVRVWGILHPLIWTIAGSCSVIILWFGGNRVIDGKISMGDFVAFNSYLGILIWPMIAIGWVVNLYQRGKASLDRLYTIFQTKSDIKESENAVDVSIKGKIEIRNVSFSYRKNNKVVLNNINLTIKPGEWLAIMGRTGSSKTTLINLLLRLYDIPPQSIFIDDVDIREYKLKSLRSQISIVPQQTFLFSDSIANNIKFGSNLSQAELEEISKISEIYYDVKEFPDGFETIIGEKGVTLSGGQKQRIAIARALAQNSKILMLDDALSAVDSETESNILKNLKKYLCDQTVILVTHRVSAAQHADMIVFLENGEIVESGTHESLVELGNRYYEIYERQRLWQEIESTEISENKNDDFKLESGE